MGTSQTAFGSAMKQHYIGLMSGTSMDGIDAVLVDFAGPSPRLLAQHHLPYADTLRQELLALCRPGEDELRRFGQLDVQLGRLYAQAVQQLLEQAAFDPTQVAAIGCHGQTVRHHPELSPPFTLQIGDPNTLAELSGIPTVMDFRRHDLAVGGEGAPLVPAFHAALLRSEDCERVIVNIGGMANLTVLPSAPEQAVSGFDTGPGNVLLDAWVERQQGLPFDRDGAWAAQGQVDEVLLESLLADPYFSRPPPKSTGREYFNLDWLLGRIGRCAPEDVQATLLELTARSIAGAVEAHGAASGELLVCGGGARNSQLMAALARRLPRWHVASSAEYGVDPQWIEAMAFAWLARQRCQELPGNLPAVTGAHRAVVLGGLYSPR